MSIQQKQAHQSYEAIVFFNEGIASKEMMYTEFEALLDGVVPMRDYVGRTLEAAYVSMDSSLSIVSVVLFLVPFDEEGFPAQTWDVPLRRLADSGARGPDLGAGPIRIATRSQCPIPGQEDCLWDVQFGAEGSTLQQLYEKLKINRLGLLAESAPSSTAQIAAQAWGAAAPQTAVAPVMPAASAAAPVTAESQDALLAVMQQNAQQIRMLNEQHQAQLAALNQQMAALQKNLNEVAAERQALNARLEEQAMQLAEAEAGFERSKRKLEEQSLAKLAEIRSGIEHERDEALAGRDRQMQAELARLEKEREVQEDQLQSLRTEITELRRSEKRLLEHGADKFFEQLKERGVKFVSHQPGAGHITIAMEDLSRFVEHTEEFVAEKCKIDVALYRRWLEHYHNPVCQGRSGSGGLCAKPLTKLLKPAEFVAGVHDRCDIHKQVPRTPAAGGKAG